MVLTCWVDLHAASSLTTSMAIKLKPMLDEVTVTRTDPVYNAHGYLTKVPITAIRPFIEAFTDPGQVVLDVFAGSGMTGVAAAVAGRRAILYDISVLAQHIGSNYVRLVDPDALRHESRKAVGRTNASVGDVYGVRCSKCTQRAELSRRTWSVIVECRSCGASVNYYHALEQADWNRSHMKCPTCSSALVLRSAKRLGEEPVLDTVRCACSRTMVEQAPSDPLADLKAETITWPDTKIDSDRQMFQASALGKHNLLTVASFFSRRNLAVLGGLLREISDIEQVELREKLRFVFTAILARASKRYQWNRKRPLNAATHNYYIAPVFYEWNVYDLFLRKVEAMINSDNFIRNALGGQLISSTIDVDYRLGSADRLAIPDGGVDYVFTDPPFGSNIFYSDMNLFHEAWLGRITDRSQEAVVDRSGNGETRRTAERYETLLTDALKECHRVLKADGWLSLVFSNSSGDLWALVQRAVRAAGFTIDPETIALLDKGQRSVKGLASGFEDVVTVDLVLSMRKSQPDDVELHPAPPSALKTALDAVLTTKTPPTASHVYLQMVREYLRQHWPIGGLNLASVSSALRKRGYSTDASTGRLNQTA